MIRDRSANGNETPSLTTDAIPAEHTHIPDPEEKDSAQNGSVAITPKPARKSIEEDKHEESPSTSPKSVLRTGTNSNLASPNDHRKIKKIQIDENLEIHQVGSSTEKLQNSDSDDAKREKKKVKSHITNNHSFIS